MSKTLAARRPVAISVVGILLLAVLIGVGTACMSVLAGEDDPQVTTDKPEYGGYEFVTITGTGFDPEQVLDIPVVRPDGSIVTGDGTDIPGFDTVIADAAGDFTYYYQLNGYPSGTYTVEVYDNSDTGHLNLLASTTFIDGRITIVTLKYSDFGFGSPVMVTLTEDPYRAHLDPHDPSNEHELSGVAADGTFTVEADTDKPGDPRLGPTTKLKLTYNTTWIEIPIHTSCSVPIGVGFVYGPDNDGTAEDPTECGTTYDACLEVTALTSFNCSVHVPSITVVKDAIPEDSQDFTFTNNIPGCSPSFDLDDDTDGTLSNTRTCSNVAPGTYSVTETVPNGWNLTSATCDDSSPVNAIDLDPSEDVTCTFTNTFVPPKITVTKVVDNTGGGTMTASQFNLHVQGQNFTDDGSGTQLTLTPSAYTVTEDDYSPAYTTEFSAGCSGTAAGGDVLSCTVTNTFVPAAGPAISLVKSANPSTVDPGDPVTFTYTITNTGGTYVSVYKLEDNVYGDITGIATCLPPLPALLAPTESVSCSYTADPGPSTDQTNTGTATANPTDDAGNDLPGIDDVQASDDAFVSVGPRAVGGIVEVWVGTADLSAQQSESAVRDYTAMAALAAGAIAAAAGALYARRRWLR